VSKRSRYARVLLALAALALVAACFVGVECRPRPPGLPADEAGLAERLLGLGYRVHVEERDREGGPGPKGFPRAVYAGLYVAREEPAEWEELASRPRGDISRWAGCAVAVRGKYAVTEALAALALANPRLLYGMLCQAAWEALREVAADPHYLGAVVAWRRETSAAGVRAGACRCGEAAGGNGGPGRRESRPRRGGARDVAAWVKSGCFLLVRAGGAC
jgi:hypothetical protein